MEQVEITYAGVIGRYDTRILTFAVLQGLLANMVEGEVNFVNVADIAEERGITTKETKKPAAVDFLNLITVSTGTPRRADCLGHGPGPQPQPRLVTVYGQDIDIEPAPHMAFLRYDDVPGMIGKIGTKLGELGINVSQVSVGRALPGRPAVMGLALDGPISEQQLAEIVAAGSLLDAKHVRL